MMRSVRGPATGELVAVRMAPDQFEKLPADRKQGEMVWARCWKTGMKLVPVIFTKEAM